MHRIPIFIKIGQTVLRYRNFLFFKMAAIRHHGFWKCENFIG